jgi:two-component system NtrC family sensor kinase
MKAASLQARKPASTRTAEQRNRPGPASRWFQRLSIRNKLLALVLLPLLVVLPLLGIVLMVWGHTAFNRLLITKVRADLAVAQGYLEQVLGRVDAGTAAVADSQTLHLALARAQDPALVSLLQQFRQRQGLDFINLRAPDGRLLMSDSGAVAGGDTTGWDPSAGAERTASIEVLEPRQFALLGPQLRARVSVPLLPTRNAAPTERTREDRALVVLCSHAIRGPDGSVMGHVQGGMLLNHNLAFIDHINEIVYPPGSLPFGSRGTATLFLDDVRISTNVRLFGTEADNRAIGTRVSQTVRDAVLGRGHTWLDRAFVVNDWYVSAYQPLADRAGRRVGMLYVGYLEQPFNLLKYGTLAGIAALFLSVMAGATIVSLRWARGIFHPIERMSRTMLAVEAGHTGARVGPVPSRDELGRLAAHLDHLLDVIDDKTRSLQRWNAELDAKVAQRTQALEARTRELQAAQRQLVRSEKLAAIGQLTAGLAHEINNPIAVIQGNLDLARELLGPQAQPVRAELKLVDEQVERMRLMVTRLLQFARPGEYAGYVEPVDTAGVVADCLVLVGPMLNRSRVTVQREASATLQPAINRSELQQVLVNLMVNALQAMPDGGTLALATRDAPGGAGVEISVADTGPGIGEELLAELFQPFVTRKQDGTGLGLWMSRGLVERYGGDIVAANRGDGVRGSVFTVRLSCEGKPSHA